VLFPYSEDYDSVEEKARLLPGKKLSLPESSVNFTLSADPGTIEILVFSSRKPIRDAMKGLKDISARGDGGVSSRGGISRAMDGDDAIDTVGTLLGDIDRNSRADVNVGTNVLGVSVNQFALISTVIRVVK
jgi:hypothetical protein